MNREWRVYFHSSAEGAWAGKRAAEMTMETLKFPFNNSVNFQESPRSPYEAIPEWKDPVPSDYKASRDVITSLSLHTMPTDNLRPPPPPPWVRTTC